MGKGKIVVGYVRGREVDGSWHDSMWSFARFHGGTIAEVASVVSGPLLADARNSIVRKFLDMESRPGWLFMVDTDMTFRPDDPIVLRDSADRDDRPIVGGLYFGGDPDHIIRPHAYVLDEDNVSHAIRGVSGPGQWEGLARVHYTGAGALMMHRDALERIGDKYTHTGYPWFAETQDGAGESVGEDATFCFRAQECGFPIYVNCDVIFGHRKVTTVDEESYREFLARQEALGEDGIKTRLIRRRRAGTVLKKVP